MPTLTLLRIIGALAVVLTITGCGLTGLGEVVPGGRRWLIPVDNRSQHPVALVVAEDSGVAGAKIGRATPDSVPAGQVVVIAFDVPPGGGWAIFVDPERHPSALITAGDVPPDEAGDLPIRIEVGEAGSYMSRRPAIQAGGVTRRPDPVAGQGAARPTDSTSVSSIINAFWTMSRQPLTM